MRKLDKSPEARTEFIESQISQQIAAQIRSMRRSENLSQPQLAQKIGTSQNQIHRLEQARTSKPKLSTLKRLAAAFDVALVVRFVPFTQYAAWVSGTPYVDKGLSTAALYVPSYEKEKEKATVLRTPTIPATASDSVIPDLLREMDISPNEGIQKLKPNIELMPIDNVIPWPIRSANIEKPVKMLGSKMQNVPAEEAKLAVAGGA